MSVLTAYAPPTDTYLSPGSINLPYLLFSIDTVLSVAGDQLVYVLIT